MLEQAHERVALTTAIEQRATIFEQAGIKAVDALHLALAEAAQVDYFCTCDDRFYRRAVVLSESTDQGTSTA
jgi:predicted nucleic acid-binding protein